MSKIISLVVNNNTPLVQPMQLLIPPNEFSGINALTQYRWDITSQNLNSLLSVAITYTLNGASTTSTASITANSITGILNALNSLNVGRFWSTTSGGSTYINTYNDFVTYTSLTINNNGNIIITVSVLAGIPLGLTLTLGASNQMFWDWGDGTVQEFNSSIPGVSHTYTTGGIYTIVVTITNPSNLLTFQRFGNITAFEIVENTLTGLQSMVLSANDISTFDASNLSNSTSLVTLRLDNNDLTTFDASPLSNSLATLWLHGNDLTSVTLPLPTGLTTLFLHANNLPVSNVNAILIALDTAGQINGQVNLSSQTPAAPPSGAGITAANNLIANGWTVTTD